MKSKAILVVSTLFLTLWWLYFICSVTLPWLLYLGIAGVIAKLVIACIAVFLIWMAIMMIQRKEYAWYLGMVVYGIPVLLSLLSFFDLVVWFFFLLAFFADSDSHSETGPQLIVAGVGILVVCAFMAIYLNKNVRLLFKRDKD